MVNQIITSLIASKLKNKTFDYNKPLTQNIQNIDATLSLPKPVQIKNQPIYDFSLNLETAIQFSKDNLTPSNIFSPNMDVIPVDANNAHIFMSSNLVNNLLWAVYNSGAVNLLLSGVLLGLIELKTDGLELIFGNILTKYPPNKGVYL